MLEAWGLLFLAGVARVGRTETASFARPETTIVGGKGPRPSVHVSLQRALSAQDTSCDYFVLNAAEEGHRFVATYWLMPVANAAVQFGQELLKHAAKSPSFSKSAAAQAVVGVCASSNLF